MKSKILLLSLIILAACSQQKYLSSTYHKKHHQNFKEINRNDYSFDEKNNIFYLLSNDEKNFYLDLKIADEDIQKKILLFGLKTEIKIENEKYGFRFPLPARKNLQKQKTARSKQNKRSEEKQDFSSLRSVIIDQAKSVEVISYVSDSDRLIRDISKEGLNGEMSITEYGELCYRLTIPLSEMGIRQLNDQFFISTSLESGYLNPENMQQNMRQKGMGKSMRGMSGMSARGGGGRGQSRMGGGKMQNLSALTSPFKLKLGLIQLSPKHEN